MTRTVAGIVLAGGAGRRYGKPKALVVFAGRPLLDRAVATLAQGGCAPVIVVVGAQADLVTQTCDVSGAVVVRNDEWASGMSGSLALGLSEARRRGATAAVVMPVDQPVVFPELVARLISRWRDGAVVAAAAFGGEQRTPVLLDRSIWHDVAETAEGESGGRAYLRSHPELVELVDCDDVGEASDIDIPADLARAEELWYRLSAPSIRRRPPHAAP